MLAVFLSRCLAALLSCCLAISLACRLAVLASSKLASPKPKAQRPDALLCVRPAVSRGQTDALAARPQSLLLGGGASPAQFCGRALKRLASALPAPCQRLASALPAPCQPRLSAERAPTRLHFRGYTQSGRNESGSPVALVASLAAACLAPCSQRAPSLARQGLRRPTRPARERVGVAPERPARRISSLRTARSQSGGRARVLGSTERVMSH